MHTGVHFLQPDRQTTAMVGSSASGDRLTDEKIVKIVMTKFQPLEAGKNAIPNEELARRFNCSRNTIARAIRRAFAAPQPLLTIRRVDRGSLVSDRDHGLEQAMLKKYPTLSDAIVIRSAAGSSDEVHRSLGHAMAPAVRSRLQGGATVAVGSGRGPNNTIVGLSHFPKLTVDSVTLMSLTGSVYAETLDEDERELLDADYNTQLLTNCFSGEVVLRTIAHLIAHDNIDAIRERTWLNDRQYDLHVPSVGIIGVGVLRGRHRWFRVATSVRPGNDAGPARGLDPVIDDLRRLVSLQSKYSDDLYCPVGDICNRLFFIPSPYPGLPQDVAREIRTTIDRVNERLLTVSWPQLARVGTIFLVAGTKVKAIAMRALLERKATGAESVHVNVVCTDSSAAEAILGYTA